MADKARRIPSKLKLTLREESGGKCANPGCANWRFHIHHIKHWAIYKSHDGAHMIAVCPSCHDEIHDGKLTISDDILYAWKGIKRKSEDRRDHIYVEPAVEQKILVGTIALQSENPEQIVFQLSNNNRFAFHVHDEDILLIDSVVKTIAGKEVLSILNNYVRAKRDNQISFERRQGKIRICVPATEDYVPSWIVSQMRVEEPNFASDGRITVQDIEVVSPGIIRVQGLWIAPEGNIVITADRLSFVQLGRQGPLSLVGDGEMSVLKFAGPVTSAMFSFAKKAR